MTIEDLRAQNLIVLECISGSKAYGLDTPRSDTDIKGVFVLPQHVYYGLHYIPQISNASNDVVFYELGRFMELLLENNPNIVELLNTPEFAVIQKHPLLDEIKSEEILSKKCSATFGKYALSQMKKAKGLKKKIINPVALERKNLLSFCYVIHDNSSISISKFLEMKGWRQEECGLVNIPHMKDVYGLYHSKTVSYAGIIRGEDSNDVSLSSVPAAEKNETVLYFNRDAYSIYCKEYKEYWEWVENRNPERYNTTQLSGKNYDAKNMMHVFRLLEMAIEIAKEKKVIVKRPNRDFLLKIKEGGFEYDELMEIAHARKIEMEIAFEKSDLQEKPDAEVINQLASRLRASFYKNTRFH